MVVVAHVSRDLVLALTAVSRGSTAVHTCVRCGLAACDVSRLVSSGTPRQLTDDGFDADTVQAEALLRSTKELGSY